VSTFGTWECPETMTSDAGAKIGLQRLQVVQNVDRLSRQAHEFRVGIFRGPTRRCPRFHGWRDRRDPAKRFDDFRAPDVAGMDDVIDTRQASFRLGPQQPMRVRNDSNPERHSILLSAAIAERRSRKLYLSGTASLVLAKSISNHSARSDFGKGLPSIGSGRPFDIKGIADQCRRIKMALGGECDNALASALSDLPQRPEWTN